jgi:hypothetical protein
MWGLGVGGYFEFCPSFFSSFDLLAARFGTTQPSSSSFWLQQRNGLTGGTKETLSHHLPRQ